MKMSQLFTQTRREAPAESDLRHYQYLVRAGYIQPLGSGAFALLPLGLCAVQKMILTLRSELTALKALEIDLPLLQSQDLWQNSGRLAGKYGPLPDQNPFPAPGQDAALFEIARSHLRSYRQLPAILYHIGAAWSPTPAGGGLFRSRLPFKLEAYTLHAAARDRETTHRRLETILSSFFEKLDLPVLQASASSPAATGQDQAWQWLVPVTGGFCRSLHCEGCGYTAVQEAARFLRETAMNEPPLPLEKVATPDCPTIESLAKFLNIPESRTAKAVFLVAERRRPGCPPEEELIFSVVRGDRQLNEAALLSLLQADALRPATDDEIRRIGAAPGYASPVELKEVFVIVDREIPDSPNLVSGANQTGFHLLNVNYGRDYQAAQVAEIALAQPGDPCQACGKPLQLVEAVACGEMLLADPTYSQEAGCTFRDESGHTQPALLGKYSLALTRLLGCLAECHHDDYGLKLPLAAAPYPVHLVMLASKTGQTEALSDEVYSRLIDAGVEPLFDDRSESPGVKFNDADLIGVPLRLTIGERGLQKGGVEYKNRISGETGIFPLEGWIDHVLNQIK
ncbi:MAG: hypothetical protein HPY59_16095 [Anaerolineae bacterium]|nr:hypothetical protein [Anaerolineae bacterium]